MNLNHQSFVAERRVAMHCAALVSAKPDADARLTAFGRLGSALEPALATRMAAVFNANGWTCEAGEAEVMLARELAEKIAPVAGNFILPVGDAGGRLFATFALPPILARLEAMFGGDAGAVDFKPGPKLPSSIELLLKRLARALTEALGTCLDAAALRAGEEATFSTDYAKLAVFPGQADAVVMPIRVAAPEGPAITLKLACRPGTVSRLLTHFSEGGAQPKPVIPEILPSAIADVPLPMRARLAEMKVPASRLMNLRPGQVLPIAVARSVPLFVGQHRVASGAMGEQDDRVALQLDRVLLTGDKA
ncbi:flagellar motor switch protein FliM [Aurantiacibacter xanthus]|uniref:Flagellar motor switch protein FliM n=1 Tax=Aurantiacibacter xanthus TaxID=1784712 RepID=A0A3A1NZJ9_9SPHN|nr:flagellar motor switch protein FliM [Aurantiacibacter xanthus]RIV81331.1 flagellar motor switch protein FliM [Aurantiacibacter xanthus]